MKLTAVLCKFRKTFVGPQPKFRGSATKGKHKFVEPATRGNRYMLWLDWKNQEEVMKYISKPYITTDQELDYLESVGLKHQDVDPLYTSRIEPPMRQRYAAEVLQYFERKRNFEEWY